VDGGVAVSVGEGCAAVGFAELGVPELAVLWFRWHPAAARIVYASKIESAVLFGVNRSIYSSFLFCFLDAQKLARAASSCRIISSKHKSNSSSKGFYGCYKIWYVSARGHAMLMEELFSRGIMTMGPSRIDPSRQVGVFKPELIATLPAIRAAEMEKFRWIVGEWSHENAVPATNVSPAYTDIGVSRFSICEGGTWICAVRPDGREIPHITFDPFSKQWIYLLFNGAYGILRSSEGWVGDRVVFTGLMTMIGINCQWRLTLIRRGPHDFSLTNEEVADDGSWIYIDKWHFRRKGGTSV
jgi:hypothetical protein